MSDLKIQGVVEVSTEGVESSLNRVGTAAENMARKVGTSADQAGKAVDGIGGGAGKSAEEFTRAEGKIVQSIKRATTQLEQFGKTASQKLEMRISTQGLDASKFEPMLAKMRELEAAQTRVGATSRGMGGQLQNTSYQLQDFIVQVNGGTDATKALGQQLPQMLVGFGAAGAAIGVIAALLPNLVQAFSSSAEGAKTFKDAMSDFDKAVGDVGSTVKSFDMEKLYEEFNKSSSAVRAATVEQLNFQQEYIKTTQLIAGKKFGESLGDLGSFGTLDKLAGAFASGGAEKLSKQLGITVDSAKQLLPILNGLKNGSEDVNNAFTQFGTVLLGGNAKSVELAKTMNDLAKAERDGAAASTAISEAQAKMSKGHVQTKKELDDLNKLREKSAKTAEQEAEALKNLIDTVNGKESNFDSNYVKNVETLAIAYGKGKLSLEQYNSVFARYIAMQPGAVAAEKELIKAEEARAKYMQTVSDETEKLIEKAKVAEYENSIIGKSAEEIAQLTEARYSERIELLESKAAAIESIAGRTQELEAIEAQIDALKRLRDAEIAKPKLQQQAREWDNFTRDIEQSLTDALFRSFESGNGFAKSFAKTLENSLKTAIAKALTQTLIATGSNALNGLINAVAGTSGTNGGAGTNYFGLANNASSMYNLYAGITGLAGGTVGASSASLAYANLVGAAGGDSLGALIAANGSWSGVSTGAAAGSTAASGTAGTAGSAGASTAGLSVGTVAWVAAIIYGMYMSNQLWNKGVTWDKTYRDKYQDNPIYRLDTLAQMRDIIDQPARSIFGDGFVNSEWYATLSGGSLSAAIHAKIAEALLGSTRMLGSTMRGMFSDAGFTDGELGINMKKTGGLFSKSKTWTDWQALPNQVDSILDGLYQETKAAYLKIGESLNDTSLADKLKSFIYAYQTAAKTAESTVVDFSAMITEAGVGLADAMGKYVFPSIASMGTAGETWSATLQRVVNEVASVDAVFKQLGTTIAEQFGKNNADRVLKLADSLVQAFGGLDAMGTAIQKYYAGYYSQTEQKDTLRGAFEQQFAALGLTLPETRTQFRRLVESLDLTSASGQKTYASLINMAEGFGAWADSLSTTVDDMSSQIEDALTGLFDGLMASVQSARDGVSSARNTVNGIDVMSAQQIAAAISASSPNSPSAANVLATQQTLQQTIANSNNAINGAIAARDAEQAAVNERNRGWAYLAVDLPNIFSSAEENITQYNEMLRISNQLASAGFSSGFNANFAPGYSNATFASLPSGYQYFLNGSPIGSGLNISHGNDWASVNGNTWWANSGARNLDLYAYKPWGNETINPWYDANIANQKAIGAASITAAEQAAVQAQIDYTKAIQQYVIDAGKAVEKLNNLREETVKYYQAQQALADTLITSANNLREAVRQARQSQMSESELLASRQREFAQAYSLALSTSGQVQASYADKMAAALPSLVTMLEAQASSQVDWERATGQLYAQSNNIAGMLEATAAVDFQSESLALLGAIDTTLAAIEANASSAEKIISDAVYKTGATTADGLRAVIAAIQGKPIPAFATGGTFVGGWRIVGENGPELEATGPSRIFNFEQTQALLSGPGVMGELVAEVRALRSENSDLRAEVRAVATHTYKSARKLEEVVGDGIIVRTETGTPLETTTV